MPILTTSNTKIQKGAAKGYMTAGIHFAPASLSGHNVCPMASEGCKLACLNTAGMGIFPNVQAARIEKTKRFFDDRESFMADLVKEIAAFVRKARKQGVIPAIRLNLTSDIQWENIEYQGKTIFAHFPDVQFYDYTKIAKRILKESKAAQFPNYHLTFSRSESNQALVNLAMEAGANVAVVFGGKELPKTYLGAPVVDGDKDDLRFLDGKGVVVGLLMKGQAKRDTSGFVVPVRG